MSSFYGNIKNNSRASFIFDRIYTSRYEMDTALSNELDENGAIKGDGVFINRYILIDYGYSAQGAYVKVSHENATADNYQNYYYYSQQESKYKPGNVYPTGNDIGYGYNTNITYYKKANFIDRYSDIDFNENEYYTANRELDKTHYHASYDHTVWMKIYSDNQEKYILVAELDAAAPTYELIADAPGVMNGAPHFDLSLSTDLNYVYHVPKNWELLLNTYKPEERDIIKQDSSDRHYWYYECDIQDKDVSFDINEEYPFYNKKGLSKTTRVIKPVKNEKISLVKTKSGDKYPVHRFKVIALTKDTYAPNRYFILNNNNALQIAEIEKDENNKYYGADITRAYYIADQDNPTTYTVCPIVYVTETERYEPTIQITASNLIYYVSQGADEDFTLSTEPFNPEATYFELTTEPIGDGEKLLLEEKDTQRLDIYLPSIGNAIATMYDAIYGKPRYTYKRIIGYTKAEEIEDYPQDDFGAYEIEGCQYSLEGDQVNNLHLPVYSSSTNELVGYITYDNFTNNYETHPLGDYLVNGYKDKYNIISTALSDNVAPVPLGNDEEPWEIPVYELGQNILGYTTEFLIPTYENVGEEENGSHIIEGKEYNLTEKDIDGLSPELIPGSYDIPVYAAENINARPYDDNKLFNTFAPPYDNLADEDNVSVGWALDALKKYISELRYLVHGKENGDNTLGLQSDWTLDDDQSFGYIYHKPNIITAFVLTSDETVNAKKQYYERVMQDDITSDNYGYFYYRPITITENPNDPVNPSQMGYYEVPQTLTQNAETDFYREEQIAGYTNSIQMQEFTQINENDTIDNNVIKCKINGQYYALTSAQLSRLQAYSDNETNIAVEYDTVVFNDAEDYFIHSGSRYVKAYKTAGSYSFQATTAAQSNENCLCYFNHLQSIKVENGNIIERKYEFIAKGDEENNIWLTTGYFHNGQPNDLDNNPEFNDKRIKRFNIVITGNEELEINDDLTIKIIERWTSRAALVDIFDEGKLYYIQTGDNEFSVMPSNADEETEGLVVIPNVSFEILEVYNEDYSIYKNRNNWPFEYNQYVVRIESYDLDSDYWERSRRNGTVYYLRDYRPIVQMDYEINTIWDSVIVDD